MPENTATKTLEAYLLQPTQWKDEALTSQTTVFSAALTDAFTSNADTQNAVNDIVKEYDLAWQAKDALKQHVPDLLDEDTYDAKELADDQPMRYTKRAATYDRDESRTHEFCWRVPMPGRGTNFWIPLQINPAHEELWQRVVDEPTRPDKADPEEVSDEFDLGDVQLKRDGGRWVLHQTVHLSVDTPDHDPRTADDVTPIGFDVGESKLLVGCALQDDTPVDPLFVDGGRTRHLRQKQASAEDRLKARDASRLIDEYVWGEYQDAVDNEIEKASTRAAEYAAQFDNPVIVLEDLDGITDEDKGSYWNRRLNKWLFAQLQSRLEDKADERGIPVAYVHPHYTSQTCHACNRIGYRPHQGTFKCPYSDCWVSEYQADLNAAAKIAHRLNPWGESLPWKTVGDDSPQSGAPVAEPQDTDESEATLDEDATSDDIDSTSRDGAADDKIQSSSPAVGAGAESETSSADAS